MSESKPLRYCRALHEFHFAKVEAFHLFDACHTIHGWTWEPLIVALRAAQVEKQVDRQLSDRSLFYIYNIEMLCLSCHLERKSSNGCLQSMQPWFCQLQGFQ